MSSIKKSLLFAVIAIFSAGLAFGYNPKSAQIDNDTSGFNGNLSSADTNVQKALNTIDDIQIVHAESDPLWSASASAGITSTLINYWNSAYSWGNHALAGYLTDASSDNKLYGRRNGMWAEYSSVETDPVFNTWLTTPPNISTFINDTGYLTSITAHDILSATHGDTLTGSATRGDIIYANSTPKWAKLAKGTSGQLLGCDANDVKWVDAPSSMIYPGSGIAISTGSAWGASIVDNSSNWNTAYGWGNHASAGYLTSESDTLASVLARGNTTSGYDIAFNTNGDVITDGTNTSIDPYNRILKDASGNNALTYSSYTAPQLNGLTTNGFVKTSSSNGTLTIDTSTYFANPMTTLGDIIYENATPTADRLAGNTTTTKMYLQSVGSGGLATAPSWQQVAYADVSGTPDLTVYAKLDGTNQPFTGNINVSKSSASILATNTGGNGKTLKMLADNATDASYLKATTGVPASTPTAFSFNGASYVSLANESQFDFDYNQPFSIDAWVYPTTSTGWGTIVSKLASNADAGYWLVKYTGTLEPFFYIYDTGGNFRRVRANQNMTLNAWNHVVATYDGSGNISGAKIYVNNSDLSTVATAGTLTNILNNTEVKIGDVIVNSVHYYFTGYIDEVVIYNRLLSASDVTSSYASGDGTYHTPTANTKAIIHVESNAIDSSGNGNHGTWTGSETYATGKVITPASDSEVQVAKVTDGASAGANGTLEWGNNTADTKINGGIVSLQVGGSTKGTLGSTMAWTLPNTITGASDAIQLKGISNATQTTNPFAWYQSDGTTIVHAFDNSGNVILKTGSDIRPTSNSTTAINIAQADGTDFVTFDTTNKRVGIGTATPSFNFHLSIDGTVPNGTLTSGTTGAVVSNTSATGFAGMVADNTYNYRPLFKAIRARGTLTAPTAVALNDYLMSFLVAGYDGSALQIPATIDMYVDGAVAGGSVPARISFVTGTNSGDRAERLKIKSDGELQIPSDGTSGAAGCLSFGAGQDGEILHTGAIFRVRSDVVTATDSLELRGGTNGIDFLIGANEEMSLTADLLTFSDATNIAFNTTTGTKIGTATIQKLGFWNTTPIVQPTTAVSAATLVGGGGTALTDTDTFDGYTLKQVVKALRNAGLLQ